MKEKMKEKRESARKGKIPTEGAMADALLESTGNPLLDSTCGFRTMPLVDRIEKHMSGLVRPLRAMYWDTDGVRTEGVIRAVAETLVAVGAHYDDEFYRVVEDKTCMRNVAVSVGYMVAIPLCGGGFGIGHSSCKPDDYAGWSEELGLSLAFCRALAGEGEVACCLGCGELLQFGSHGMYLWPIPRAEQERLFHLDCERLFGKRPGGGK